MNPPALAMALNERAIRAIPDAPEFNRALADPALTDIFDGCAWQLGYLKVP